MSSADTGSSSGLSGVIHRGPWENYCTIDAQFNWSEVAELRRALARAQLSEPISVPTLDAIATEAARAAGTPAAAVVICDGDRRCCTGAAGPLEPEWRVATAPPGWQRIAGVAVRGPGSHLPVGELAVFSPAGEPNIRSVPMLEPLAKIVEAVLAHRGQEASAVTDVSVALVDQNAALLGVSRELEDLLGWKVEEVVGGNALDLIHPDDWNLAAETFGRTATSPGRRPALEMRIMRADGSNMSMEIVADNRLDDESIRAIVLELSPRAPESDESAVGERTRQILGLLARGLSPHAVAAACEASVEAHFGGSCRVLVRTDGIFESLAGSVSDMPSETVLAGTPPATSVETEKPVVVGEWEGDARPWWAFPIIGGRDERVLGVLEVRPEGRRTPSSAARSVLLTTAQLCAVAIAWQRAEMETRDQLTLDPATGLGNRAMLTARLQDSDGFSISAVLACHLGGLDLVRRTYGNDTADDVLSTYADTLRSVLGEGDAAFRTADDELAVVLCDGREPDAALAIARRIADRAAEPVAVYGRDVVCDITIGVAMSTESPSRLLAEAELAVHGARTGGEQIELFCPEMLQAVLRSFELEAELRQALRAGEFVLHYQPKVHLATERVVGVEALLRWAHPRRGLIPPDEFIPALEYSGLIIPVGKFVLDQATRQVAAWASEGVSLDIVQVNASPLQLNDPGFTGAVRAIIDSRRLGDTRLNIEITESVLGERQDRAQQTVLELAAAGVEFAIDDFGTGYSSFQRLQHFPIAELKIDKSFVSTIADGEEAPPLISSMLNLANALGIRTVAEGVETAHQARVLAELGCEYAQGYYFSKPLPPHLLQEQVLGTKRAS